MFRKPQDFARTGAARGLAVRREGGWTSPRPSRDKGAGDFPDF